MKNNTQTYIVRNEDIRKALSGIVANLPLDPVLDVVIREHKKDRTLAQNRLSHMHYKQIGEQMFEHPSEVKSRCKLDYGVPILLLSESTKAKDFAKRWLSVAAHQGREQQLDGVSMVNVTSLMTVKEFTEYIQEYMGVHQQNGIYLSHPSDLWLEAMGR